MLYMVQAYALWSVELKRVTLHKPCMRQDRRIWPAYILFKIVYLPRTYT